MSAAGGRGHSRRRRPSGPQRRAELALWVMVGIAVWRPWPAAQRGSPRRSCSAFVIPLMFVAFQDALLAWYTML